MDPAPLWRGASDRADFRALLMALEHAPELLERDDVDRLLDLLLRDYMLKKSRSMMLPDVARFDAVDPRDAMRLFRFELPSISCIAQQVLGGAPLHTQEGDVYEPIYGTCLMLRYLAAPVRLQDLELEFGRLDEDELLLIEGEPSRALPSMRDTTTVIVGEHRQGCRGEARSE